MNDYQPFAPFDMTNLIKIVSGHFPSIYVNMEMKCLDMHHQSEINY